MRSRFSQNRGSGESTLTQRAVRSSDVGVYFLQAAARSGRPITGWKRKQPKLFETKSVRAAFITGAQGGSSRIISTSRSAQALRRASPVKPSTRSISLLYFGRSK